MRLLSVEAQQRARNFLFTHARPLERARYLYHFEGDEPDRVLSELASFGNPDGGFGHALEQDLRLPASSVLATTVALQILREVEAPSDHPLVTNAMNYLLQTYDPAGQVWPIVPPNTDDAPHAPWWDYGEDVAANWNGFLGNPRAEILGYLYDYSPLGLPTWVRESLTSAAISFLDEQSDKVSIFDLLCYDRLVRSRSLPDSTRERLLYSLLPLAKKLVNTNPADWEKYGIEPIELVDGSDSPFAELFAEAVPQNLDAEIERQSDDGAWHPKWTWYDDAYPDDWPIAERDAAGVITLRTLRILRSFGRLAEP